MTESMAKLAVKCVTLQGEKDDLQKQCNALIKIILALKSGEITIDKVEIKGGNGVHHS